MMEVPTVEEIISGLEENGWRVAVDISREEALAAGDDWWFGWVDGDDWYAALSPAAQNALAQVRKTWAPSPEEELALAESPSSWWN